MKRRAFFRSLAVAPLAATAFVREPDKLTEREYDEFLDLAMRYQNPKKPKTMLELSYEEITELYNRTGSRKGFVVRRGQDSVMHGIDCHIRTNKV